MPLLLLMRERTWTVVQETATVTSSIDETATVASSRDGTATIFTPTDKLFFKLLGVVFEGSSGAPRYDGYRHPFRPLIFGLFGDEFNIVLFPKLAQ